LLTCNPEIGQDVVNLFHSLTGYALKQRYQKVMIAPQNMRKTFNHLIDQEIEFQRQSRNGKIIAKMNALDDVHLIQRLYQASQAGVRIDLIIRGHSRLRPGLKGYSDNIRLISILGRFLEHDRIFYFHNNNQPLIYIGSADWRGRNLNERVELITPIEEPALQQRLLRLLETALSDNRLAWDLEAEGSYRLRYPESPDQERNFHDLLIAQAQERSRQNPSLGFYGGPVYYND
jgi:polyphosphate kinase